MTGGPMSLMPLGKCLMKANQHSFGYYVSHEADQIFLL